MIPLFIDCSGRRIVIFGGGMVASRKAAYFREEGEVTVISRSFSKKISGLAVRREVLDVSTRPDDELAALLPGAFLVIAALSDPAQNDRIGRLCRERGILFNNADGERGDVIVPAVTGGSQYTLAVSTRGSSPALSRFLREHLEEAFPALDAMILLQERVRNHLRHTEPSAARRKALLARVLRDPAVWQSLDGDPDLAWEQVRRRYLHD